MSSTNASYTRFLATNDTPEERKYPSEEEEKKQPKRQKRIQSKYEIPTRINIPGFSAPDIHLNPVSIANSDEDSSSDSQRSASI